MNKKLLIGIISCVICMITIIAFCFFRKNNYKTVEFGNTNIKSVENIKEYILNISSYDAEITAEIRSNKSINKYKIIQKYSQPNIFKQQIIEPSNIKGLTITYDGTNLEMDNTRNKFE